MELCYYIPPRNRGDCQPIATIMENHNQQFHQEDTSADGHLRWRTLNLVPVGGPVLLTHLVELGLDDLDNLRVVWVGLRNADM